MQDKKAKDEFISTLSHEIRTPLTSIKGFSKTMLDNWGALDETSKKKFVGIILEQSERLINLVENVLNIAKLEGGVEIITKEVNILSLITNTVEALKISYPDKKFMVQSAKTLNSMADKNRLEQVFTNIIENACKYSLENNNIEIKIENKNDYNVVGVKNFGSYIAPGDYKKVFEKFYRVDNYLTSNTQGSGLGLYIAKNLIEKMNGKIEVNSNKEENFTEFLIYIPLVDSESMTKKIKNGGQKDV